MLKFQTQTCSERPLPCIMSEVLGSEIKEDNVHSLLMCKKCYKLFDEVDELELRVAELKSELQGSYKKSIYKNKNWDFPEENEKTLIVVKDKSEADKENQVPKKILDIPSSDDENTDVRKTH